MTIDTTLSVSGALRFRKNLFMLIKMIETDQLKIIDNKIKENQAQYLTSKDLGYKPSVVK